MPNLAPIEIDPKTFLHQHCNLPALPRVVNQIQEMILKDNVDLAKVVRLISADPALVAQIIKVVNSAYYGLPKEVSEIRFAIAFLGLNEVYRMVLSLSVINTLSVDEKDELTRFWYHSFYASICTKHLARTYARHLSFDELWSAAILHDIGKLIYLKFFPEHYHELVTFCEEQGCLFSQAEKHFSLPSSAFFGSLLCDHWRLPAKIKSACEFHSIDSLSADRVNSLSSDFKNMIILGNLVSILSVGDKSDETNRIIAEAIKTALQCNDTKFLALMGEIYELRTDVEKFMEQFQ